ncbi:YciI family protein [Actinomadura gamaensis]|uniref:YciI family protein n=1 Tax=Actinomadura gamaensis TaxID=1763541 RepID=A0ABV9U6T6_9ACTN
MEFFCYHRDRLGSVPLREAMIEEHWSYMDGFEKELIARGPVFDTDEDETLLGSVHIVDVPTPAAAREFAFNEPCYQAGAYRDVLIRRWHNLLGRTMWDFPGFRDGGDYFMVLALGEGEPVDTSVPSVPSVQDDLVAYGPLYSDDGTIWVGTAALLRAPDATTARAILTEARYADIEAHPWTFGGRR